MKFVALILVALSLTACGIVDRAIGSVTGYSKVCVDGVSYLQFTSGATVQYDQTGKVVGCK